MSSSVIAANGTGAAPVTAPNAPMPPGALIMKSGGNSLLPLHNDSHSLTAPDA